MSQPTGTPDYEPRLADHGGDMSKRWFIDYRIWDSDKQAYVRKQYTGMNKYTTLRERQRVAKKKLAEIKALLAQGYTAGAAPTVAAGLDIHKGTVLEAVQIVMFNKTSSGPGRSGEDYQRLVKRLQENPAPALASMPFRLVKPTHVLEFMTLLSNRPSFGPKSYNSYRDTLASVYKFFIKLEVIDKNPVQGVERRRVTDSAQHQPYTEAQRQLIRAELERRGEHQLLLFICFIYFCFIRSGGELRLLRVRDLLPDTILVPGARAKNGKAEHVAIPTKLEKVIQAHKLRSFPPDFYVFTKMQEPGPVPLGKNYFARRHRDILEAVGLAEENLTVYSYKHTGAINLYLATRDIELVRRHCRHAHAGITATYLRGLGALHDGAEVDAMPDF
ncbi:hypothetical protein GCM10023185_13090 [Hymenobacter saemangeumensis]|uniref:Site-specific integrase n=1 Tax=Hymenobacter saemangeumensis TaxID=1084522 RepID=A0ABP8I7E8_9BACT